MGVLPATMVPASRPDCQARPVSSEFHEGRTDPVPRRCARADAHAAGAQPFQKSRSKRCGGGPRLHSAAHLVWRLSPTQLGRCPVRALGFGSSVDGGLLSLRYGPAVHPRGSASGDESGQSESTGCGCPSHRPFITGAIDSSSSFAAAPASSPFPANYVIAVPSRIRARGRAQLRLPVTDGSHLSSPSTAHETRAIH